MANETDYRQENPRLNRRANILILVLLLVLTGLAFGLRVWDLNSIPPWLWWDEASLGLDARDILQGQFRAFFPRHWAGNRSTSI